MNQFVAAIVAVVVVLSLIQSVIAAQGDTPVTATTNSIICHEHAYDETCLTQSWSPWTQSWTEVYRQQQCCLTFWLKRLSPELQTDSTPPPSPLYTKDIWGNVFNSVPNTTEKKELKQKHKADQNAFQKRYEHVAEPTIRFVTSKTQIISIVANSPRAYVFILPRFIPPQHEEETEVEVEMWRSGKVLKVISTVGQLHQSLSTHPARKQLESEEHHRNDNKRFGVIPFGMNPTIVDLLLKSDQSIVASDEQRTHLLTCLYSSTLDQQNTSFTEKRCGQANLPKGLCSLCHWVDTTLYKDNNAVELFSIFLKSKFVVFVDHDLIPPILEVLACGAVPLLASKESFLESVVEQIQDKDVQKLSVEYLSTFDNYVTEEAEKKLKTVFADMLLKKENYSIAPLTFAFWLSKVIPFDAMNSHISRQHSRHHAFVHQHLPFLRYNLQLSSGKIQNIYLQNPVKVKEFCHVPIMGNMKKTKLQMEYPTSHLAHVDSEAMVDIVLPRCCETIDGDLAWLQDIATSLTFGNKNQTWLRVHIYYKCPWCIPKSLYKTWKPLIHSSRENSTAGDILRSKGGVYLLNDFPSSTNNFIHHYPAFDWRVNGKETTAYLQHIVQHYPQHNFAKFTMFLHTQPSHHLDLTRFVRFLSYVKICQVEGGVRLAAHNEVAHQALEFLPLNYRWMSDKWAHQPEQCLMSLLDHMFQKSTILGDEKRLPPASYQGVVFSKMKIASNVAAQFVVSNHRIYQRPYDFWWKLFQVNNGNTSIASCPSRSYKEGTEVACAMERIWHNFFRDANPHTRQNFHADSKADSPLITEPLFMEDYPQCCKHFLPALLTTYPRPSSSNHQANILLLPESTSLSSFKHENRNNRHQQRTPILDVDNNNRQSFEISSSNSFQEKESKMRPSQQKQSQRQQRHRSSAPKSFRNF